MDFFTSPKDLQEWVKVQPSSQNAAMTIKDMVGIVSDAADSISSNYEQDISDTCREIYDNNDENASKILFGILASHNLVTLKTSSNKDVMKKEAQIMRQPGQYQMPLRVCPKLPFSVGKRLISTYNCRHYCLDGIALDDDPERIYCGEALWRRHVMDKFSREFKDANGKWVGGYINSRFHVFPDAGTPANPDVPRDGGNKMELAHGERTRLPRPHQYSIERRLSEARGEETFDITPTGFSSNKNIKTASIIDDEKEIAEMFSDMIDMKESGLSDEDIVYHTANHYGKSIQFVFSVFKSAMKKMASNGGIIYTYSAVAKDGSMSKIAQASILQPGINLITNQSVEAISEGKTISVASGTPVVMVSQSSSNPEFEIVDGLDAGKRFKLANLSEASFVFTPVPDGEDIKQDAENLGLVDSADNLTGKAPVSNPKDSDDFPVEEI